MSLEIRIWRFIKRCWKNEDVVNFSDYGNTNGKHQEEEGFLLVKDFLSDSGMTQAQINRVSFLVGHHHTFLGINGLDWQVLIVDFRLIWSYTPN